MTMRSLLSWWLPLALCACASPGRQEGEFWLRTFRRQRLTETFFSEGATFGDLNRDGHLDLIAGIVTSGSSPPHFTIARTSMV